MHDTGLLFQLLLLVGLAIPIVALAHRIGAPPLVGFLLAGVLIGPHGLGLIANPDDVSALSEIGIALLLFTVGLELSLSHVLRWARQVFLGGALQVGGTLLLTMLVAPLFGISTSQSVFFGALVAMSSTAVVTKTYADRTELDSPHGRFAVSILLFQDLCILPLMLLLPMLADAGSQTGWRDLLLGVLAMAVLVGGGRFVVRWTLDRIVLLRDRELFTLCVGFFGIGAALVTSSVGFSLAIGAFIAGLLISESEYGLQALADVLPFRAMFSGVFFTSVGMLFDVPLLFGNPTLVLGLTFGIMVAKFTVVSLTGLALRHSASTSLATGMGLAQVGEFSFVLAASALPLGLFGSSSYPLFISVASLSMMMTPLIIQIARPVARTMGRSLETADGDLDTLESRTDHVIIVGYGLAGRYLSRAIKASRIACVVVEQNTELVQRARQDGIPVVFGDGTQPSVLEHVGIADARVVVFAISSPADELRGVGLAHMLNPTARIIVRTRYVRAIERLMAQGATAIVVEEFEASLELFARALESYEIPLNRIWRELESLRDEHYAVLRDADPGGLKLDALKHLGIHEALELVEVEEGSTADGENARTLDLRRQTGTIQVAVVRDGRPIYRRDPDFRYRAGDTAVLVGDRESLERATALFQHAD